MKPFDGDQSGPCIRVAKCYLSSGMGQPVKLSENLVLDARIVGETSERSIASQIEFWARLGRAVEPVLRTETVLRLKKRGEAVPLSACLSSVDTASGRERVKAHLAAGPYPHFEPAPGRPGFIVKIDEDGTRTVGRFVNRQFRPAGRQ
ncbi:ParD-like family protein [Anaeromyxobacter oryzisoli]|uniref:ParD-like family protein n=1 Tax=Anaeromyxobacter oryzisoli TaxID=2925408 RepID=UPI001F58E111|nr:ParD-like family protein [Anaeromyxobacter sp. SG63]